MRTMATLCMAGTAIRNVRLVRVSPGHTHYARMPISKEGIHWGVVQGPTGVIWI